MSGPEKRSKETRDGSSAQNVDLLDASETTIGLGIGTPGEGDRLPGITKEYSGWDVYNNEARKMDMELVKDWRESLNSLLLFAAIFAAVLTAFIIESKKLLEEDPNRKMVEILIFYTNNLANGTHREYIPTMFEPNPSVISLNCLFFASLSTSLVAALASVIALQWVADYDAAITRGGSSPEDRAKRRQFRYAGVVQWKMSEIIAALPLLLYCSVTLFFAGLILWMCLVNLVVGVVVAGGAATALLFYGSSTLLAVAFVSAPFRTPLSRWTYTLVHDVLSFIYLIAQNLRIPLVPALLENRHLTHVISRKRVDAEVEKRGELAVDALVWLANHLSVSQDSYRRLLLLASELPKLGSQYFSAPSFGDAPWFQIFDLLAWRNLQNHHRQDVSEQEMHAVTILASCHSISEIYDIICPTDEAAYNSDTNEDEYWSQYCDIARAHWTPHSHSDRPNALFLLLRDIPLPTRNTTDQIELTIFLSRWRNSRENTPRLRKHQFDHKTISSSASSDTSRIERYESLYATIVSRMTKLVVSHSAPIAPDFLDLLRARFESLLVWEGDDINPSSCLSMPVFYSDALEGSPVEMRSLHYAFTLLLSRNVNQYTGVERVRRVRELITMMWIGVAASWYKDNMRQERGMENFFEANKPTLMKWIKYADTIPNIHEILGHLASALASQPEVGPIWRVMHPSADVNPHFIQALRTFDRLIGMGVTPSQHRTLIDLICQDIELGLPEGFAGRFSAHEFQAAEQFIDPCLRFFVKYVAGLDADYMYPPHPATDPRTKSWARIATHLMESYQHTDSPHIMCLQASMWPVIPDYGNDLCEEGLKEPKTLAHLRQMFAYPVPCSQHHDTEGHLLLHLFEKIPSCKISVDMTSLTTIPMKGRTINALLLTLVLSNRSGVPPEVLPDYINENSSEQLLEIVSTVQQSQFSLLALLSDIATRIINDDIPYLIICSEDVAAFSICVNRALSLPLDRRAAPIIHPLVNRLRQLKNIMLARKRRPKEENDTASREADCAIRHLVAHLVSMTVPGAQNSRVLSCTRSQEMCNPAIGWLPAHID